jgi:UDP-glucose 4-epimerase
MTRRHPREPDHGGMSVLVTGGSGLIGGYVVDALADRGQEVVIYDGRPPTSEDPRVRLALGELFDLPRLLHVLREEGVEQIVHAADVAHPLVSVQMPVATVVSNVEGTLHLLEAARLGDVRGRIVLLSSNVVYGDNAGPIDESSPLRPRTPYAVTKVTGEQLGDVYTRLYELDVIALRLGETYGPNLPLPALLWALVTASFTGQRFRAPSGAEQTLHLTHGEDVSRGVLAALDAPQPKQRVYNITGGESYSLSDVVALIRDRFPDSCIEVGPGHLPEFDRQGSLDIRAADRELGYRPRWGLARGIDDYAEWFSAQNGAMGAA